MSRKKKIISIIALVCCLSVLLGLFFTGLSIGWGPFSFAYWPKEYSRVVAENPYDEYQDSIVFYGASNFRLWKEMKDDLAPYNVANCGFGGSTDSQLMEKADELLYPYNPKLVFLQTGSNDYAKINGTDEEITQKVIETKIEMFNTFHENLPDAHFFVMAGILMPGRDSYTPIVKEINAFLREYCETADYLTFIDSEELTYKDGQYITEYFISDGIHLTHEARLIWANDYILPVIREYNGNQQ